MAKQRVLSDLANDLKELEEMAKKVVLSDSSNDLKGLDEVKCPVCMEHPHDAVLLICSSRLKSCRPFMCDTSKRHSNCLNQYHRKQALDNKIKQQDSYLSCPLCRGIVTFGTIDCAARDYMNTMSRSCSLESCGFVGTYAELRKHARAEHPTACPSEADPERQRDWLRIVQEQDHQDFFSAFRLGPSEAPIRQVPHHTVPMIFRFGPESSEDEAGGGWMFIIDTFPGGSPGVIGHDVSEEHGNVDHGVLQEARPATQGRQDEEGDAHADGNDTGI